MQVGSLGISTYKNIGGSGEPQKPVRNFSEPTGNARCGPGMVPCTYKGKER